MFGREKRRYDGVLVGNLDPVVFLMPYIMPNRTNSETKIDLRVDITKAEAFIKQHREDIPGLTLFHLVYACIIRAAAITPEINRFICGNRIYQRDTVKISMMVKKHLEVDGAESSIMPRFEYTDSLAEIVAKINAAMEEAFKEDESDNGAFDKLIHILYHVPPFILRAFVNLMMWLDRYGHLPKGLVDVQPFHSGFFVTNVGSIGLPVIYHHLYEFGTTSMFVAIGRKEMERELQPNGTVRTYKVLPLRVVCDDRICDGFTYSVAFKTMQKCFSNPEILLEGYKGPTVKPTRASEGEAS